MGNFKRKLLLLSGYFVVTPSLLLFSLIFLTYLSYQKNPTHRLLTLFSPANKVAYAALPSVQSIEIEEITQKDARTELVRQFFEQYGSPLTPFADLVVSTSDFYGLDFRLLPAIAMQESNLCKKAPAGSHNCWGFGIYGGKVTRFEDYKEAIETVSKTLAKQYKNKGLDTPDEIVKKYTPSDNGKWVNGVTHFMDQLQ